MATPGNNATARSRTATWLRAVADQLDAGVVEVLRADAEWEIGEYATSAPATWIERGPTGIRTYTLELRHFADAARWAAIEAEHPEARVVD